MKADPTTRGFTLIEMLVVIAIIAILATLVVPAVSSILAASLITTASDGLSARVNGARQTALARNHAVEFRFYRFGDPNAPGENPQNPASGHFRAYQTFEILDNGTVAPLTKVERLPDGTILDSGVNAPATLSSLLGDSRQKNFDPSSANDSKVNLPGVGQFYDCRYFQFRPSGSTDLGTTNWFVTVHRLVDGDALAKAPANFETVQVDAVSGAVKTYRP